MNELVTQTQLPAHLAHLAQYNPGAAAMGGITSGSAIYQIGIKTSRWRLQSPNGKEDVVANHHLDIIITDANPNLSKVFYIGTYNPADTEFKAPDCYSDNGVGPNARSAKPQCSTCAACPNNVWGSKVTPSGSQTKACTDSKKLAVILADNPTGPVYLFKIPAASLKNLFQFVESLSNRGIPLPGIVVRLTFDAQADYPKILFAPKGWASVEQVAAISKVLGTEELKSVIGLKDVASVPVSAPAPVAQISASAPDPFAGLETSAPPAALTPASAPEAAPKRTRRTKAQIQEDDAAKILAAGTQVHYATAVPSDPFAGLVTSAPAAAAQPAVISTPFADIPNHLQPAAAVVITPQPTDTALDDLLAAALKV